MICAVWISQNVIIHHLLLISVYTFAYARSSECACEFVMKFLLAQFSWIWRMFYVLNRNWSIEIFSISSYTKLQSLIHRSFECNLIPRTSYRSDKGIHFSNNQFMNGILTWFGCNFPSESCELFWAIFTFTTLFSLWKMVHESKHFFSLLSAQNI